jgi:hypothetical protein
VNGPGFWEAPERVQLPRTTLRPFRDVTGYLEPCYASFPMLRNRITTRVLQKKAEWSATCFENRRNANPKPLRAKSHVFSGLAMSFWHRGSTGEAPISAKIRIDPADGAR